MNKLITFLNLIIFSYGVSAENKPIQEPPLKFENQQAKAKTNTESKSKDLKSKWKAPRKIFPKSEKVQKDPEAAKSLDEQIKDADRSDMEE